MVEFFELEQLVAFADHGTLSRAAEQLHLSQPSLTRTIKRLEAELRVPLVDRERNRVTLNANGEMAVRHARRILEARDGLVEQVREFDRANRTIAIASCAPAPLWDMAPLLSSLYPDTSIATTLTETEDFTSDLIAGRIQLAIGTSAASEAGGLLSIPFMREHLHLVVPRSHMLARLNTIRFRDFNGLDLLLRPDIGFWARVCRELLPASRLMFQTGADTFQALVRRTDLPYFATDVSLRSVNRIPEDRVAIPIADEEASAVFHLLCRKTDAERFAMFLRKVADMGRSAGLLAADRP
ncbi:LysR family transcriptional regulator [Bifidobacterium samirii]|uniref:Transcriptional regulator n=1 Tax=Bifidobacterium samirii TaxID=2306974 RepID=A0A430FVF9_9BIFI|nr:LysR family transcriptional regulator [Bifidobacterium samirii]RSX57773.1 transcriptional regulator [Bifidobacterium samirii]